MTDIEARLRAVPTIPCADCQASEEEVICAAPDPDWSALAAVVREMVEVKDTAFKQAIADLFDGMACDPRCDAEAHEETCPATHGPSAVRILRATLVEQALEIERMREALEHADTWFHEMANTNTLDATVDLRAHIAAALRPTPEAGGS